MHNKHLCLIMEEKYLHGNDSWRPFFLRYFLGKRQRLP
uniref:Uncharacterized protein n=1 Tax=Arundo donax TaxID=35708 RepID=A0A0A8ZKT5_ARUDO